MNRNGGSYDAAALNNFDELRKQAVNNGTVRLTITLQHSDVSASNSITTKAALSATRVAEFEARHVGKVSGPTVRDQLFPTLTIYADAQGLDAILADSMVTRFGDPTYFDEHMSAVNQILGTANLPLHNGVSSGILAVIDSGISATSNNLGIAASRIVKSACYSTSETGLSNLCPDNATSVPPLVVPPLVTPLTSFNGSAAGVSCFTAAGIYQLAANNCGHGTHVSAIASAGANGIAPAAKLFAIQASSLRSTGISSRPQERQYLETDVSNALAAVIQNVQTSAGRIKVVNMSFGYDNRSTLGKCEGTAPAITTPPIPAPTIATRALRHVYGCATGFGFATSLT